MLFRSKDISFIFTYCSSLLSLPNISKWNTYNIINIEYAFSNCSSLSTIPDISNWKTDNLKKIFNIFYGCESLISLPNISKWNISKIKNKQDILSLSLFQKKENSLSNYLIYSESSHSLSLSNNIDKKENNTLIYTYTNFDSFNNNDEELNNYYENFFN